MGANQSVRELNTVENLDINRYLGKWYQIARKPNYFQSDSGTNTTAEYSLDDYDNLRVVNSEIVDGRLKVSEASGYIRPGTSSKLRVSFFPCIYGDYYVIMLGSDYEYSVVSDKTGKYLWILSRTQKLDKLDVIMEKIEVLGVDISDLIITKHE